jgi:hypothetical protein
MVLKMSTFFPTFCFSWTISGRLGSGSLDPGGTLTNSYQTFGDYEQTGGGITFRDSVASAIGLPGGQSSSK